MGAAEIQIQTMSALGATLPIAIILLGVWLIVRHYSKKN